MSRYEYPSLRQGLVGAWCPSLGGGSLMADRSGRTNHTPIDPLVGFTADPAGRSQGVSLALQNWYVLSSGRVPLSGNLAVTISLWVRTSTTTFSSLVGFGSGAVLGSCGIFTQSNQVIFGFGGHGAQSGSVPLSVLTHVAVTKTPGQIDQTASIYTDGVLSPHSGASTSTPNVGSSGLYFGTSPVLVGNYRNSSLLDDIRLYSRALTAPEIRLLASRRGIGLVPLPDRAAGLPRKLSVNVGGSWRDGDAYVNTGSEWRLGIPSVNNAGTWR